MAETIAVDCTVLGLQAVVGAGPALPCELVLERTAHSKWSSLTAETSRGRADPRLAPEPAIRQPPSEQRDRSSRSLADDTQTASQPLRPSNLVVPPGPDEQPAPSVAKAFRPPRYYYEYHLHAIMRTYLACLAWVRCRRPVASQRPLV
ncbi:hypothetical protein ACCO45_001069 [Purpureocillium lilacinum]|uniref:Uncharacterized protein n=1 Tax=Purpureocillium lilacinum TaxID=33203 RepID=A0ACC4E5Y9_PURLI